MALALIVASCGRMCVEKMWIVFRALPKRTNAQRRARTRFSRMFDSKGMGQLDVVPDVVTMWSQLDEVLPRSRRSPSAPNITLKKLRV